MSILFRIDDVSIRTDVQKLTRFVSVIRERIPAASIMLAISPLVYSVPSTENPERVFSSMLHVEHDFRAFYRVRDAGVPKVAHLADEIAAHGLVHADHRLLKRSAQELSILVSCSLVGTNFFVPPFHKWNTKTAEICAEHRIRLVMRSVWSMHLKYKKVAYLGEHPDSHYEYYFHAHDFVDENELSSRLA